jgi:hypothetical protein
VVELVECKTCVSNKYQEERHPDYDVSVPCDTCSTIKYSRWQSAKQAALVEAAKNLLAFLEDHGECEICTQGGRGDEGGVFFELGRYDRVALPDRELEKLQNALQDAINEMEGSDTK